MSTTGRALRSNTDLTQETSKQPPPTPSVMAGPTKRRASEIEKFSCSSCAENKPSRLFPDYNPSPDCEHLIHTCKSCLRKWVEACIEDAKFRTGPAVKDKAEEGDAAEKNVWGVGCPECASIMRSVNVQIAVPKKVFNRFNELERKHIADTTPNWRWCLAPGCRGGQVHIPKGSQPPEEPPAKRRKQSKTSSRKAAASVEEEPDVMTCNTCSARACARCDRPMHDGETCTAYQARIKDRLEEEDKSLKELRKVTKQCPGCSKNIQKNGGCPSMNCSQCGAAFCWNCVKVFDRGYCGCHPPPSQAGGPR